MLVLAALTDEFTQHNKKFRRPLTTTAAAQHTPQKLLFVLYFHVPDEDINRERSDLAASGGSILQYRLSYCSCEFAFIDAALVKSHTNIFKVPPPIVPQPTVPGSSVRPAPFIIDLELDMWKKKEKAQQE